MFVIFSVLINFVHHSSSSILFAPCLSYHPFADCFEIVIFPTSPACPAMTSSLSLSMGCLTVFAYVGFWSQGCYLLLIFVLFTCMFCWCCLHSSWVCLVCSFDNCIKFFSLFRLLSMIICNFGLPSSLPMPISAHTLWCLYLLLPLILSLFLLS